MEVVYFDFSKVFNTVSHNILIGKLMSCEMDEWTVRWVVNWQSSEGCVWLIRV